MRRAARTAVVTAAGSVLVGQVVALALTADLAAAEPSPTLDVPTVNIVSPGPSRAGQMTVMSDPGTVVARYAGAATAVSCEWDWGDGLQSTSTPAEGLCRDSHDYAGESESATRLVTVRVVFDQGGSTVEATDTAEIAVHHYYVARLLAPQDGATVANPVTVHFDTGGSFVRPVIAEIDWGDDQTSACTEYSCSHRYAASGRYEVTARAEWELLGTRVRWSDLVAVRVAPPPTATWGVVELQSGVTTNFAVRQGEPATDAVDGGVWVHKGRNEFRSEEVTDLSGGLGNAVVEAEGSWKGAPGYTLELSVLDYGGGDQATVTIRDTKGDVVLNAGGDVIVTGGLSVLG